MLVAARSFVCIASQTIRERFAGGACAQTQSFGKAFVEAY
jgi:hypothetical protein